MEFERKKIEEGKRKEKNTQIKGKKGSFYKATKWVHGVLKL
jgi:hypothetical protein